MGTICILLGLIIFIASIFGGCVVANAFLTSATPYIGTTFTAISLSPAAVYGVCVGVLGFIGLLICLNLVMNGLIYNKLRKLGKRR